jgi:hypothetical protein
MTVNTTLEQLRQDPELADFIATIDRRLAQGLVDPEGYLEERGHLLDGEDEEVSLNRDGRLTDEEIAARRRLIAKKTIALTLIENELEQPSTAGQYEIYDEADDDEPAGMSYGATVDEALDRFNRDALHGEGRLQEDLLDRPAIVLGDAVFRARRARRK